MVSVRKWTRGASKTVGVDKHEPNMKTENSNQRPPSPSSSATTTVAPSTSTSQPSTTHIPHPSPSYLTASSGPNHLLSSLLHCHHDSYYLGRHRHPWHRRKPSHRHRRACLASPASQEGRFGHPPMGGIGVRTLRLGYRKMRTLIPHRGAGERQKARAASEESPPQMSETTAVNRTLYAASHLVEERLYIQRSIPLF